MPQVTPRAKAKTDTLVLFVIRVAENRPFDVFSEGLILLSSSFTRSGGSCSSCGNGVIAALASGSNATAAPPKSAPKIVSRRAAKKNRKCFRNVCGKVRKTQRRRDNFSVLEPPVCSSAYARVSNDSRE